MKIGEKYGNWEVISDFYYTKNHAMVVQCKCGCNAVKEVQVQSLTTGKSKWCNECRKNQSIVFNQKINEFTVIGVCFSKGDRGQSYVPVRCSCGYEYEINKHTLLHGRTKKCKHCKGFKGEGELGMSFFNSIREGAIKRNYEFSIDIKYAWDLFLHQNKKCALTDIPLELCGKYYQQQRKKQTASLDRINNKKGYIEGNVQWVHKLVNKFKSDMKQEDLIYFSNLIAKKFPQ
jgi:hypothetical protein